MTKSMKSLMMGAALAGFMAGNTAMAQTPSSTSNQRFFQRLEPGPAVNLFRQGKARLQGPELVQGQGRL